MLKRTLKLLFYPVAGALGLRMDPDPLERDRLAGSRAWWERTEVGEPIRARLCDDFLHTPLNGDREQAFLRQRGVAVGRRGPVDLHLLGRSPTTLRLVQVRLRTLRPTPILVWTHEPRFDTHFAGFYPGRRLRPPIHVMNCYTGDVWIHPGIWSQYSLDRRLEPVGPGALRNRKVVALMSHRDDYSLVREGRELDLTRLRQELALCGHRRGVLDICGRGWPGDVSIENSRSGDWRERKLELLAGYGFNLALENTNTPRYCTEKLWDSMVGGCLPIYHGRGNRIYETFPRASFLDYADFDAPDQLFDYIENMSEQEYVERMNRCIEVFNRVRDAGFEALEDDCLSRLVTKIRAAVHAD